jgi:hypothetical protein
MRLFSLVVMLLICSSVIAQQNLFNIPSGDITKKNNVFYQHQFNIYDTKFESKGHFVYGLGRGWDIGVNLVGKGVGFNPRLDFLTNDNPLVGALAPHLMPTLQKQFQLLKNLDVNFGTQTGINLADAWNAKELAYFHYGIGVFHFMDHKSRLIGGLYHTNRNFVGEGTRTGLLVGYEIKVAPRTYLMGDWISGDNESSAAVIGGMYNVTKRFQLCAGVLIPNTGNENSPGFVLELNFFAWDLSMK